MKFKFPLYLLAFVAALTISCSEEDPEKADGKEVIILAEKMESDESKLEFTHNPSNQVTVVKSSYYYPNNVVLETNYSYTYTSDGKYLQCVTDNGYRFDYTYEGDKLVRTDEYIDDSFTQYYAFVYNDEGRITEMVTWQNIPEEGGWVPVSKGTYTYDGASNVTRQTLYYYDTGTAQHEILTVFDYELYDSKISVEGLFANLTVNPAIKLSKNNPGKVSTTNAHGVTGFINNFSYTYDDLGYPVTRTIESIVVSSGDKSSRSQQYSYLKRQ
jgi:hypothetical protein